MTEDSENETSTNENKSKSIPSLAGILMGRINLSESIILASIPIVAYWTLFTFQLGYLSFYNIPGQFIRLSITDVLAASATLLILTFFLFTSISVFSAALLVSPRSIIAKFRKHYFYFLAFMISTIILIIGSILFNFQFALLATIGFLILAFFAGFLGYRAAHRGIENVGGIRLTEFKLSELFINLSAFVWFLILTWLLIFSAGKLLAITRINYPVSGNNPTMVVLFVTENQLILSTFNPQTKQIDPGFTVLGTDNLNGQMFYIEQIGPLRMNTDAIQDPSLRSIPSGLIITPTPPP